jgi:hypothetical protein
MCDVTNPLTEAEHAATDARSARWPTIVMTVRRLRVLDEPWPTRPTAIAWRRVRSAPRAARNAIADIAPARSARRMLPGASARLSFG